MVRGCRARSKPGVHTDAALPEATGRFSAENQIGPATEPLRRLRAGDDGVDAQPRLEADAHPRLGHAEMPGGVGRLLALDNPIKVFDTKYATIAYDVAPDEKRFLIINENATDDPIRAPAGMVAVLNWTEELKRLVPTR